MALITVLMTLALVVILLTTVFQSQAFRSTLLRYDTDRETAREAAVSVLEYGRFMLEEDQTWLGAEELTLTPPLNSEGESVFEVKSLERSEEVKDDEDRLVAFIVALNGTLHADQDIDFTLVLTNNLPNQVGDLGLLPHSCTLDVTTRFGTARVHHIWTLRHAAFSNSTVAASGNIEMDTENVVFSSTDSSRNQIRSMADIHLPDAKQMEFQPVGGWQRQEKGTVWAHNEIRVGPEEAPVPLEEAAEETGAQFIPNGRSAYRVPKLNVKDVGADPEVDSISEIESGDYTIGTTTVQVMDLSGVVHEKAIPVVLRGVEDEPSDLFFVESHLQDGLPDLDLSTLRLVSDPDTSIQAFPTTGVVALGGPLQATLVQDGPCQLTLPAKKKVVCEGSLSISGFSSNQLPKLTFTSPAEPDEELPKGYLECKGGDLAIACDLENAGMLMASGDVSILPADVKVEASLSADLAIFAGGDVSIDPRLVETSLAEVEEAGKKLGFRGLIYAGGDVVFDTVSDHKTPTRGAIYFHRDIEVEGALVARGGEVKVVGEYGAELRYNPDFLDDVMESSLSSQNRQLEVVAAREL